MRSTIVALLCATALLLGAGCGKSDDKAKEQTPNEKFCGTIHRTLLSTQPDPTKVTSNDELRVYQKGLNNYVQGIKITTATAPVELRPALVTIQQAIVTQNASVQLAKTTAELQVRVTAAKATPASAKVVAAGKRVRTWVSANCR